jgi:hypothetical protein
VALADVEHLRPCDQAQHLVLRRRGPRATTYSGTTNQDPAALHPRLGLCCSNGEERGGMLSFLPLRGCNRPQRSPRQLLCSASQRSAGRPKLDRQGHFGPLCYCRRSARSKAASAWLHTQPLPHHPGVAKRKGPGPFPTVRSDLCPSGRPLYPKDGTLQEGFSLAAGGGSAPIPDARRVDVPRTGSTNSGP